MMDPSENYESLELDQYEIPISTINGTHQGNRTQDVTVTRIYSSIRSRTYVALIGVLSVLVLISMTLNIWLALNSGKCQDSSGETTAITGASVTPSIPGSTGNKPGSTELVTCPSCPLPTESTPARTCPSCTSCSSCPPPTGKECPPAPTCPSCTSCPSCIPTSTCTECPPAPTCPSCTSCSGCPACPACISEPLCPIGFPLLRPGTNSCYRWESSRTTWQQAVERCKLYGGYLAAVETEEEDTWLFQVAAAGSDFWLGATDSEEEGKWVWVGTGQPVTYTNWGPNEPKNLSTHSVMAHDSIGGWEDANYFATDPFFCEIRAVN